jgi:hypothetical protein
MKTNNLVKIIGAGLVGVASAIGGTYYALNPPVYSVEPRQTGNMEGLEQLPGKVLDAVGESFEQGLKDFAEDYKAHPEKYDNCLDKK